MLTAEQMALLIPEIYTRLCMVPEEWEYGIPVPGRRDLLGLAVGETKSDFQATPIIVNTEGSRIDLPPRRFTQRVQGTLEVAGQSHQNIRLVSIDEPHVELWDWLISDPWNRISSPSPR